MDLGNRDVLLYKCYIHIQIGGNKLTKQVAAQRALETIEQLGGKAADFRNKWLTIQVFSSEFEQKINEKR